MNSLSILSLKPADAAALSGLLKSDEVGYHRYFQPFPFDATTLEKVLAEAKMDRFWGIYIDTVLIGFFMLRGLDSGYDIPSYGVYVSKGRSGRGISGLTLNFVEVWCKLNNIRKVMIKVHPENLIAKRVYEKAGALPAGTDKKNGNLVYYLSIWGPLDR